MQNYHEASYLLSVAESKLSHLPLVDHNAEARFLLAPLLKSTPSSVEFRENITCEEAKIYFEWVERRMKMEPLEYITGESSFLGLKLKVTPDVLIPRHETEILADMVYAPDGALVFDVGTGSGCLGLSVKKKFPTVKAVLSDCSIKALNVAKENSIANGLLDVDFVLGDTFSPFDCYGKADVILCNPPYVEESEYACLEDEVRLYEPKIALVGGVSFYKKIEKSLFRYLAPGGKAFLEMGRGQDGYLLDLFSSAYNVSCKKDWAGINRYLIVENDLSKHYNVGYNK